MYDFFTNTVIIKENLLPSVNELSFCKKMKEQKQTKKKKKKQLPPKNKVNGEREGSEKVSRGWWITALSVDIVLERRLPICNRVYGRNGIS